MKILDQYWAEIVHLFKEIEALAPMEILRDEAQLNDYIANVHTQLVFCTPKHISKIFPKKSFTFQTLVLLNAQTLTDTDAVLAASLCKVRRVIVTGPLS